MLNNKLSRITSITVLAVILSVFIYSCGDDGPPIINVKEPITFVQPDTTIVKAFPGESIALNIFLATDRVIDTLRGAYHIDSTNMGFDPLMDGTTEFLAAGFLTENNIQEYIGSYALPNSLKSFDVVRLIFTMEAGERNYSKTLRIDIK